MRFSKIIFFIISCFVFSSPSYAGIEDILNAVRRLDAESAGEVVERFVHQSPGALTDLDELRGVLKQIDVSQSLRVGIPSMEELPLSLIGRSRERILERLQLEVKGVLGARGTSEARFLRGTFHLPTTNLARHGIDLSSATSTWNDFHRIHRQLSRILDEVELSLARSADAPEGLGEYVRGVGQSAAVLRWVTETLGDIAVHVDEAVAKTGADQNTTSAFFPQWFTSIGDLWKEVTIGKVFMENHLSRLSRWADTDPSDLGKIFATWRDSYRSNGLPQRFSRLKSLSEDLSHIYDQYSTFVDPFLKSQEVGKGEYSLTLLWGQEVFSSLQKSVGNLRVWASRHPEFIPLAQAVEDIVKTRARFIGQEFGKIQFNINYANWLRKAKPLEDVITRKTRSTRSVWGEIMSVKTPEETVQIIEDEFRRVATSDSSAQRAVAELLFDIDQGLSNFIKVSQEESQSIKESGQLAKNFLEASRRLELLVVQARSFTDDGKPIHLISRAEAREGLLSEIRLRRDLAQFLSTLE